jgi:anti-sigma factor RsiW
MTDRRCKQIFAMLSDYLDGTLKPRDRRELEEHLCDCQPCAHYLRTLKFTTEACRQYGDLKLSGPFSEAHSASSSQLPKGVRNQPAAIAVRDLGASRGALPQEGRVADSRLLWTKTKVSARCRHQNC